MFTLKSISMMRNGVFHMIRRNGVLSVGRNDHNFGSVKKHNHDHITGRSCLFHTSRTRLGAFGDISWVGLPLSVKFSSIVVGIPLVMYLYKAVATILFQNKLIYMSYLPFGCRDAELFRSESDPGKFGFDKRYVEDLYIETKDGCFLHCWYFNQSDQLAAGNESPDKNKNVLLYFHGNAGHMGHRLEHIRKLFRTTGMDILTVSYRGYGLSKGSYPSEKGLKRDAEAVCEYLIGRLAGSGRKLVLFGHSLGGAVAIYSASVFQQEVEAVILENTFTSVEDIVLDWYPKFTPYPYITWALWNRWESAKTIKSISPKVRFLFLSGAKDETIPPRMMKELCCVVKEKQSDSIPQTNRESSCVFKSIPNGLHNDTWMCTGYYSTIQSFLQQASK
eukprot:Nk52_evm2s823 gene=Nk52_evmTU2s823